MAGAKEAGRSSTRCRRALEDADLHCRPQAQRHCRTLRDRRTDQWRELRCLGRAVPNPGAEAGQHRRHRQPRQPQRKPRAKAPEGGRHQALLPAALLARPQPDRASLLQAQAIAPQGQRADRRSHLAPPRLPALDNFTPHECETYIRNAGYA